MADEAARLREALERIVDGVWPIGGYDDMTGADHMREIARAALAAGKREGGGLKMADGIITRQQYTHDYVDGLRARVKEAETRAERAEATVAKYKTALDAINVVRNSIVGLQRFGFSEHAYPLVAALDKAGIEGMPYDTARPHFEGLLGRALEAEATAKALTAEVAYLRAWKAWAGGMAHRLLAANPEPQPPEGVAP